VRTPLGEIHARTREYAPRLARGDEIDVERSQLCLAEPGDGEIWTRQT
jgi:hypothetical protein